MTNSKAGKEEWKMNQEKKTVGKREQRQTDRQRRYKHES